MQCGKNGGRGMSFTHIYVWDRLILTAGPGRENSIHRHFGTVVVMTPDAPMILTGDGETRIAAQAAVIAPNAWHRMDCRNSRTVTILVGPDHPWFCYVKPVLNGASIVPLDPQVLAPGELSWDELFGGASDCVRVRQRTQQLLQAISGPHVPPHQLDERIAQVVAVLHENVIRPPALQELGRRIGLSGFTLMRRFKRELGVRIGEYVLWRRLMYALTLVDGRSTITEIAHRTGFYDQAHLTRTVRRMVELAPSFFNDLSQTRVHQCQES